MARKKKDAPAKAEQQQPVQNNKWLGFNEEQDMLTFVYLFTSRKDLRTQCQEAIRRCKNDAELVKEFKRIAIDGTSPRASVYEQIIETYETKTDWMSIIAKFKEKIAAGI